MLQDLEASRPMELEAVVGAVVELGEKLHVAMPATRAVYACAQSPRRAPESARRAACSGGFTVKVNNRWFQLCASLITMIMIANLQYAWTLFVKPLQHSTGWSLSAIQWAFTLFILCQTWVQPLQGWLIDRLGQRAFISAAGVLCGAGWAGLAYARTLTMLYVLYAVAGIGAALVYSGSMGSALKWFRERRGLAAGIMAAGFGGGTALFIPVISSTIRLHGYETAFIRTGVGQGLVILIVAQFLRHPPVEIVKVPEAKASGKSAHLESRQFTTLEMLATPQFYFLYAMFVLMSTGGLIVTAQAGPMAQSWGLPATALTLAASLSPLANGASRIVWGWASDRMGRENTMAPPHPTTPTQHHTTTPPPPNHPPHPPNPPPPPPTPPPPPPPPPFVFVLQAICLMLVIALGHLSSFWFALTLVLTYFTWGEIYSLIPSTVGDYFGSRHATSNNSVVYSAKGVAAIIGGGLAARLFEHAGTWSLALYGSTAMALVAAAMAVGLRSLSAPAHSAVPAAAPALIGAPAPRE